MFEKKSWKPRLGVGLNKYSIDNSDPVSVINIPDSVTQPGDAFSSENMNGLEQRISDAFDSGELGVGAQVSTDGSGSKIEAIQLGEGTNSTPRTVQAYDYRLLNADGTIPPERLTTIPEVNIVDNLESSSNTSALAAHQGKVLDEKKADKETTLGGFQAGHLAMTNGAGAAIGANSEVWYGGAIGDGAKTTNGFAGGNGAVTRDTIGELIDAIQLGTGVNSTPGTLQIYNYQLLDADGNIPAERLTNVSAGGGKSYSTIVMGTSAAGYTASDVDYLCSGSNDSTQFTAALGALPSTGGRILMLEGTYRLQNISIAKSGVVIEGMGEGTVIEHADRSSGEYTTPIITVGSSLSGIKIKNLKMFGGLTQYDKSVVYAVAASSPTEFSGVTFNDFSSFSNGTVSNISFEGCDGFEIETLGDSNSIRGCDCELGIISGDKNIISDCALKSCATDYTCYTISGDGNIISGCVIEPEFMDTFMTISGQNNLISSNKMSSTAYTGIGVNGAGNVLSSNHIELNESYSASVSVGAGSIACGNVVKGSITGSGTFSGLNITS